MGVVGVCWQHDCIRFGQPQHGIAMPITMPSPRQAVEAVCSECKIRLSAIGSTPLIHSHER